MTEPGGQRPGGAGEPGPPRVVLAGSLDTKEREYRYVRDLLTAAGVRPIVVDFGILADPSLTPDVSAWEVAAAGGTDLETLRGRRDVPGARSEAIGVMRAGLATIVRRLHTDGRCDGMLGLGGGEGSTVISAAMRALPIGFPKLLVTTMSPANLAMYYGVRDLTIMYAVTDIAGLNEVSRPILRNAAAAVTGMVTAPPAVSPAERRPLIALTMFGTTTRGAMRIQQRLEAEGFDTVVFHAVGTGGRAMEDMIDAGLIDGVVDLTPSELTDELFGGIFPAGPGRLCAAGRQGIPQVVVPGALAQVTFGPEAGMPRRFSGPGRHWVVHSPSVTVARADAAEGAAAGALLAKKVNEATGPRAVVLPLGGLSDYEMAGGPLADAGADAELFAAIRSGLLAQIPLIEHPGDINAADFADLVTQTFLRLWHEYANEHESVNEKETQ